MLEFLNRETETCEILITRYAGARRLLYKNHLSAIIEVFRPLLEKGKMILWQSKRIRSHIRSGCVSITSSSPLSIDERLFIINYRFPDLPCYRSTADLDFFFGRPLSDGELRETQTADYFSNLYPIDRVVLSVNA